MAEEGSSWLGRWRVFRHVPCGCGRCPDDGWYWEAWRCDGVRAGGGLAPSRLRGELTALHCLDEVRRLARERGLL